MSSQESQESSEPGDQADVTPKAELDRLKSELKQEQDRSNGYLTQLKYLKADFENYQKRSKKEIADIIEFANERLILKLLTQIDDLERVIASAETADKTVLINGFKLILTELKRTLAEEGVEEIKAKGAPFDPAQHEASSVLHSEEYPDQTVVEEERKGYMLKGRVLRPSVVKVARRPAKTSGFKVKNGESDQSG